MALDKLATSFDQAISELNDVLQQELAVMHEQADQLPLLGERKQHLCQQLQQLDRQAQMLFRQQPETKSDPQWAAFKQRLQECKMQNERNGRLIQMRLKATHRQQWTITRLTKRTSMTYDAKGMVQAGQRRLSAGISA